jgi:hypothetical protein
MATLICEDRVTMSDIKQMSTPPATATHFPISHYDAITTVLTQMEKMGFEHSDLEIGVSHKANRCYWLMKVNNDVIAKDWNTVIGGRNSHDKSFSFGLFGGFETFICSNLQATGEVAIRTKHTKKINERIPEMVSIALNRIDRSNQVNQERINKYKEYFLPSEQTDYDDIQDDEVKINQSFQSSDFIHDFIIKSMDKGVISSSHIKYILDEWRKPKYEEFYPRTAWSLTNCYTEGFKRYKNPAQLYSRGIILTKMIDKLCNFTAPEMEQPSTEEIMVN